MVCYRVREEPVKVLNETSIVFSNPGDKFVYQSQCKSFTLSPICSKGRQKTVFRCQTRYQMSFRTLDIKNIQKQKPLIFCAPERCSSTFTFYLKSSCLVLDACLVAFITASKQRHKCLTCFNNCFVSTGTQHFYNFFWCYKVNA